jgi:molybdopterin-guanine dinucleotide biosynthesis protein A
MTTRRDVQQGTVLRYSLAAGRFVPPRRQVNHQDNQQANQQANQGVVDVAPYVAPYVAPWRWFKQMQQASVSTAKRQSERQSKRDVLAARAKRVVSGRAVSQDGDGHNNSHIKGYSGAVLATSAMLQRSPHLPHDAYLGKPLLAHTLASLEHAYERFVITDDNHHVDGDVDTEVTRYPELLASQRALSGLHSALSFAFQDWVAVVAYDLPYVSSYYWDYMFAKRGGAPIVIAQDASGEFVPLAALYHRSVIMQVAHLLENSQGDLEELLSVCGATVIPWESLEVRFGRQLFTSAVAVGQPPL